MRYEVTISGKGTITLPAAIRKVLGLKPGQRVRQSLEGNKIVIDFPEEPKKTDSARAKAQNK